MNKNSKIITAVLLIIAIVVVILIARSRDQVKTPGIVDETSSSTPVAVSETVKVSSTLSSYENAELGFSVKYPSSWEKEETSAGVTFIIPIDKDQVSTVATLQSAIQVMGGTCAFPPVTTIKERSNVKVGDKNFDMISMSNSVKGINYFNRMYSLQKGDICYMLSFASITQSLSSKNLTGSNAAQAQNNNKAIVNSADSAFTDTVKSFEFVVGPQGKDETQVPGAR